MSLTIRPPGMKKLVPPMRSSSSKSPGRQQHRKRKQAQNGGEEPCPAGEGQFISESPRARRSSVVAMKLMAPSMDATQKRAMEMIQRFSPTAMPGPAAPPTALRAADKKSSRQWAGRRG